MRLHNPNTPAAVERHPLSIKRKFSASLFAASLLLTSACATNSSDKLAKGAATSEAQVVHDIFAKKPVEIFPGAILTDGSVTLRGTPAVINTNNASMTSGNEVTENAPFSLMRPIVVESDGNKWLGGVSVTGELNWVVLNDQTSPHMSYYSKIGQPAASFCNDQLLGAFNGVVYSDNSGLSIHPDGFKKPVAQLDVLTNQTGISNFVANMQSAGYTQTKLCP